MQASKVKPRSASVSLCSRLNIVVFFNFIWYTYSVVYYSEIKKEKVVCYCSISFFIFLVFEASPNKQRTKVVIEQNKATALIAFSDKKRVDYESIDIVQETHTSKTKKE